jgi:hypothetical protein
MRKLTRSQCLIGLALVVAAAVAVEAQSALAALGLSESAARAFVISDVKSPSDGRASNIAIAGTRAFLKLPAAARGPAATALFAWARAYVNSPAFKTAYASFRRDAGAGLTGNTEYETTVEQEVRKQLDEQLQSLAQMKERVPSLPPADRAKILASIAESEARLHDPETVKELRRTIEVKRAETSATESDLAKSVNEKYPPDPQKLFVRRLRAFLDATAEVNFAARTISLTGGADGIEFIDPPDRKRHWMWQEAAIVGREATMAARAAATAWLQEIER